VGCFSVLLTFKKEDESTSGLLTINNILKDRKFFNKDLNDKENLDELLNLWPEYENLNDILNKNGYVSKKIKIDDFNSIRKETDEFSYLINQDKHFYLLQRFSNGKIFRLDPVLERPEVCTDSFLKILNAYKSKHKNREAIEVYKIVQSNSSITINPINENLPVHDTISNANLPTSNLDNIQNSNANMHCYNTNVDNTNVNDNNSIIQ
jgi:hypothetical protein